MKPLVSVVIDDIVQVVIKATGHVVIDANRQNAVEATGHVVFKAIGW